MTNQPAMTEANDVELPDDQHVRTNDLLRSIRDTLPAFETVDCRVNVCRILFDPNEFTTVRQGGDANRTRTGERIENHAARRARCTNRPRCEFNGKRARVIRAVAFLLDRPDGQQGIEGRIPVGRLTESPQALMRERKAFVVELGGARARPDDLAVHGEPHKPGRMNRRAIAKADLVVEPDERRDIQARGKNEVEPCLIGGFRPIVGVAEFANATGPPVPAFVEGKRRDARTERVVRRRCHHRVNRAANAGNDVGAIANVNRGVPCAVGDFHARNGSKIGKPQPLGFAA